MTMPTHIETSGAPVSQAGRLVGKSAFVLGGSSGIGRAIALRFAAEGAAVTVASRRREAKEGGLPTDELIRQNGGTAEYMKLEVTDADAVDRVIGDAIKSMGGLHIMVTSAGAVGGAGDSREVKVGEFDEQFAVDVRGTFLCARAAFRHFIPARYGKIVMISSNFGHVGVAGLAAYCSAKLAVVGLARAMALEVAPMGINVNVLCPGATKTAMGDGYRTDPAVMEKWSQMTPLRMPGEQFIAEATDIADAALFLASDESRFMTGQSLVVDGGWAAQ
jgi:NAD(P)-dependent dehydrogenase (short-subunit alcohol dehydrogenase family)